MLDFIFSEPRDLLEVDRFTIPMKGFNGVSLVVNRMPIEQRSADSFMAVLVNDS